MRLRLYQISQCRREPGSSAPRAGEPEALSNWPKEVQVEGRRRRNIAIALRMAAREDRERRAAMGF